MRVVPLTGLILVLSAATALAEQGPPSVEINRTPLPVQPGPGETEDDDEAEPDPTDTEAAPALPPPAAPPPGAAPVAPDAISVADALAYLQDPATPLKVRQDAVRALAFRGSRRGDAELQRILVEDPDVSVRFLAARALEHRKVGGPALAQALQSDPDPRVRRAAARALGRMGPDGTRQEAALLTALEDPAPHVVEEALGALKKVGSRASLETLTPLKTATDKTVRKNARTAHKAVTKRVQARDAERARRETMRQAGLDPQGSTPLLGRVLRFGGTVWMTAFGAALGTTVGALLPLAFVGPIGVAFWPLGAGAGFFGGGLLGLGYGALRRFEFPLTDALLVSVHGASGFVTGLGMGLSLGRRGQPAYTAGLAALGGGASLLASAGISPWIRARPAAVASAASGGFLAGSATLLAAGALGYDPVQKPDVALGLAFIGQGVGTALGTALAAGVPVTSLDVVMVDLGAVSGAALATAGTLGALVFSRASINVGLINGTVLSGMVLGAGAGALLAAILPETFERRLTSGLSLEGIPVTLMPAMPTPDVNPQTGKVQGATVPMFAGTFR
ncbi:MAG: HEAT repeat domain-containing protein [Myxococcota bacterium]